MMLMLMMLTLLCLYRQPADHLSRFLLLPLLRYCHYHYHCLYHYHYRYRYHYHYHYRYQYHYHYHCCYRERKTARWMQVVVCRDKKQPSTRSIPSRAAAGATGAMPADGLEGGSVEGVVFG